MPERDLRVAYRVGFEDALDVVAEVIAKDGRGAEPVLKDVRALIARIHTSKARRILEDLKGAKGA